MGNLGGLSPQGSVAVGSILEYNIYYLSMANAISLFRSGFLSG